MNTKKLLLAALLGCAFAPVLAEEIGEADEAHIERRIVTPGGADIKVQVGPLDELRALDGMPFPGQMTGMQGKLVKNAPYSAEMVTERQQNLADGNQIATRLTSMSYRDSAGRTRQEQRDSKGEPRLVMIKDPVANVIWLLHPQDKRATRMRSDPELARAAGEAARTRSEQLRKEGKLPAGERGGPNGEAVIVKRVERGDGDAARQVQEDVRIRVEKDFGDGKGKTTREMYMPLSEMVAGAVGDIKWASKATTKELGSRDIDGVKADGKLRSFEIPAGEVGNRNPIVVSDEIWYAPDLQVTVYTKHSDPRWGDSIFHVRALKRDEPDAALFTLPADYTVKDVMANIGPKLEKKTQ